MAALSPFGKPLTFRVGAYAPGGYMCKCIACGSQFEGDKRAVNCLTCAIESLLAVTRLTMAHIKAIPLPQLTEAQLEARNHLRRLIRDAGVQWAGSLAGTTYAGVELAADGLPVADAKGSRCQGADGVCDWQGCPMEAHIWTDLNHCPLEASQ